MSLIDGQWWGDILKSVSISSLESPASIPFHAIENQDAPTTTTTGNQMPPSTGISICCGRTRLNSNRSYPKQQQWLQRTPETVMPLDRRGLTGEPANNRSIQFHLIVRRTASSPRRCGGECTLPDTRSSQPSHSAAAAMSGTSIFNSSSNSNCRRHSGLIILPSTTRRAGFVIRWFPRSETGQTTMDRRSVCLFAKPTTQLIWVVWPVATFLFWSSLDPIRFGWCLLIQNWSDLIGALYEINFDNQSPRDL